MSRKIIGVTVGTTLPKPNFKQTDPTKGDYIKNKPDFDGLKSKVEQIEVRVDTMQENAYDDTELRGIVSENVAKVDTLNELVGNTKVETQIGDAVTALESEIDNKFDTMQSDIDSKVDAVDGMGLSTNDYTTAEKDKLATVEPNANFYEHPTHASHSSGLYKVTVDESGHVSGATLATKEDIVALGIPEQDTTYDTEISDLGDRIDGVEDGINTTNQTLSDVSQEFENYKTANNEAVSTNATNIASNKDSIEVIQGDYLTSIDKTQLQDDISKVSGKATDNAAAIEVLNGEGDGSIKQSIDNAFNEFAANVTNDDVVNTYKELIDYAATHGPEFAELVGKVDTIDTHVGEIEADLSNYKTAVSDQFTEVDTTINNHVTDTNNPHVVTKEQVGLANVDNTSDLEKPISNAAQAALDEKADLEHAHSDLYYDKDEIEELVTVDDIDDICGSNVIIDGGNSSVISYATKQWVQDGYQPKGNYLTSVPDGYATESYVDTKISAIQTPDVSGQINTHNLATDAHNDIRLLIDGLSTRLSTLADCDDTTLDQMSEVVEYIKNNQSLIEGVTTKKVNVSDIIDNLTTNVSNKPLSAAQGVVLNGLIEELTSNLSNYQPKGDYLTEVPIGYATEEFVKNQIADAELGNGSGNTIYYMNNAVEYPEPEPEDGGISFTAYFIKKSSLSNNGTGIKKGDIIVASNGTLCKVTKVEMSDVTYEPIGTISEDFNSSGGNVDLTGYATEQYVQEYAQPKGNYLTEIPEGYAKTEDIPTKPADIGAQPAGNYLTQHQDISGLLPRTELPTAINAALAQAKESGEFDGKDAEGTLRVTIDSSTMKADHTSVEINEANKAGRLVYLVNGSKFAYLDFCNNIVAYFRTASMYEGDLGVLFLEDTYTVDSDGEVSMSSKSLDDYKNVKSVNGQTPDENGNVEISVSDSGENVDLTGYATEQWVQEGYQPKGNYLTEHQSLDGLASELYVDYKIATIPTPDVSGQINTHNTATDAHADIRQQINELLDGKADKAYIVQLFEELKALIQSGNTESAIAVLDEAILDLTTLA